MNLNLPVLLLNKNILLPQNEIKLEFNDELSKSIVEEAEILHNNNILVVTKTSLEKNILISDLPRIGTIAKITRKLELPNGNFRIILKGVSRKRIIEYLNPSKYILEAIITDIPKENLSKEVKEGLLRKLLSELYSYIDKVPYMSNSLISLISNTNDLEIVTDIIVNHMSLDTTRILSYLKEPRASKRVEMILEDIYKEEQLYNIEKNLDTKVKKGLDKDQKDFYLKEKIKLIKSELGEGNTKEDEVLNLKSKVDALDAPSNIKNKILYEISKYDNLSSISPEIGFVKNYIDYMLDLPWNKVSIDFDDLNTVKKTLDKKHYGLMDVKLRIIEYLAVKKHANNVDTPIICLSGPPGVGKTTLASSIAESMGRSFVKISVGGVDDEAIIKGHIRTYIASLPGRIIDGIKRAKTSNPVFLIDEIDKMSTTYKGDPINALLEVLDPIQNKHFKDNYIEEEYDLSKVLFIVTANDVSNLPKALKDRLEIINIGGYTYLEKLDIAKNYLIPTICESHGINKIKISDESILNIIRFYTHESGLRELKRLIAKIVRKMVTEKVLNNKKITLTVKDIEKYLGKKIYINELESGEVGVVNALAYTEVGGDVLKIECNHYKGNGNLILTGQMGDIMLDSAKIALSYIKANAKEFNINEKLFEDDIHINIPSVLSKKDGPSGGVAITTAIISALKNIKINSDIAYTGEITLRGNILKVGGIKEKIIGAYLNNIKKVFIPYSNIEDLSDVPEEIKEKIEFIPVKNYEDIFESINSN